MRAPEAAARASVAAMADFDRHGSKARSGVWHDLAVGRRKTEVDAQIAVIATEYAEVGVPTRVVERLVALIREIEEGPRTQEWLLFDRMLSP